MTRGYPVCPLHHRPLVDDLPGRCPLGQDDPLRAVAAIQDAGYLALAPGPTQDTTAGLADLERARVCDRCITVLLADPRVHRLRAVRGAHRTQRAHTAVPPRPPASSSEEPLTIIAKRRSTRPCH